MRVWCFLVALAALIPLPLPSAATLTCPTPLTCARDWTPGLDGGSQFTVYASDNNSASSAESPAPTLPEPATLALFSLALIGLAYRARRHSRAQKDKKEESDQLTSSGSGAPKGDV
jgi:hypothetical protein